MAPSRWQRRHRFYGRRRNSRPKTDCPSQKQARTWWTIIVSVFTSYIYVMSAVSFASFIMEEAMQTCMFGSFAINKAKGKAKDPEGAKVVYENCQLIHNSAYYFIHTVGWINPFNFVYVRYLQADGAYWYAFAKNQGIDNGKDHTTDKGR